MCAVNAFLSRVLSLMYELDPNIPARRKTTRFQTGYGRMDSFRYRRTMMRTSSRQRLSRPCASTTAQLNPPHRPTPSAKIKLDVRMQRCSAGSGSCSSSSGPLSSAHGLQASMRPAHMSESARAALAAAVASATRSAGTRRNSLSDSSHTQLSSSSNGFSSSCTLCRLHPPQLNPHMDTHTQHVAMHPQHI